MRRRRSGNEKITREEGVALVKRYDQEFPAKYYPEFLDYIGLNEQEFAATVDKVPLAASLGAFRQ